MLHWARINSNNCSKSATELGERLARWDLGRKGLCPGTRKLYDRDACTKANTKRFAWYDVADAAHNMAKCEAWHSMVKLDLLFIVAMNIPFQLT